MTLLLYKILAAILVFLTSIVAVIYPLRHRRSLEHPETIELGEALASGIFLGTAFFHMLPDSISTFNHLYGELAFPIPELICVIGFLLLVFLDRLSLIKKAASTKQSIPYILALILIIHALTEGAALGVGMTYSETIMLLIAIIAHKGSESYALCMAMLRQALPSKQIVMIIFVFALMTPIGIGLGTAITSDVFSGHGELAAAIFNAFAAGTFLYISTLHHIRFHQHTEETQGMLEFLFLVLGLGSMGLISLWA